VPELPEVETTLRGVAPHLLGRRVAEVRVRDGRLRWPVPEDLARHLTGARVERARRRGKYLLLGLDDGALMIHLGMSGSLRILAANKAPGRHDHIDLVMDSGRLLRFTDPRRFGSFHWLSRDDDSHPLLRHLGLEPLSPDFDGPALHAASRGRRAPVKSLIMDQRVLVGVGNIYANEALFAAGIRPTRRADRVNRAGCERLAARIREVLENAIRMGGTTLRDYTDERGRPGYFAQSLLVYGRGGLPCRRCGRALKEVRLGQRTTVYCAGCQR
jgi:formamidopyrimidine-DNA glycosylase